MKHILVLMALGLILVSCKNKAETPHKTLDEVDQQPSYISIGMAIDDAYVLETDAILETYKNLKIGDTITTKMNAEIIEVCANKGCWMTLDLKNQEQIMVKFKDYGFFMPLDAKGEVIVNGKAFISETSVEELKHYAEDAGKSEAEIAAITAPKLEYHFEADGVLLKK